ncbi:hypothetical protein MesoLjLc_03880 [Mesorhizobium sp. L-8-10]|nr:hypothetical protein MesoLjLc_03880 [Mesorhizobium sp. L-8-10]
MHAISEGTRSFVGEAPGISLALYGAVLVVMVLFMPRGLAGLLARRARKRHEDRVAAGDAEVAGHA